MQVIDGWHRERKFARGEAFRKLQNSTLTSIGYHFIIYTNGAVATGRHLDEAGAHAYLNNRNSIGVCLVGTDQFTAEQWASLKANIEGLKRQLPNAQVCGHRDLPNVHKTCPGFDVAAWIAGGMWAPAGHVLGAGA